ncbi:MAG: hypothetical protein HQL23_08765 [Candidatus Omnitrophica bacterium]|nr:hypothetical protein [Candidatus Omnitrophota bacterium]
MKLTRLLLVFSLGVVSGLVMGCETPVAGRHGPAAIAAGEAVWIRDGEPIEFEKEKWFPQDGVETLLDNEVYLVGRYRGVPFYVEKIDVRPYDRLYTYFGEHQYRYFEKRKQP